MGSVNIKVLIRYFFPCSIKMRVFDVLHHLVTYLWTKRYKCCIKSANYVMLTYVRCIVGLLNKRHLSCYTVDSLAFMFFCECVNLNVSYFFLSHLLYQNSSLVGHILLKWFYPYQSILLSLPLTTFQISSFPELYECLNKLKLL